MTLDDLVQAGRIWASVPDAAALLGLDKRTVRLACEAGEIPATKIGARWMIRVSWLQDQAAPAGLPAQPIDVRELEALAELAGERGAERAMARFAQLAQGLVPAGGA